ncbi:hypothetical protein JOQ06_012607 [Pogonophryne albipinna]|uniref:lysozyme n=1 Tax=Pogonophryne albipinna TaxID=1090488 RepID=A0AAD6FSA7_9TELE|nr:hypothetical protein JOQ06_012607 [Pogonophryne albipinna]
MRVFVCLFLVSVLGCSLAEGRVVTKCELKDVFNNLPEGAWPQGHTMTDDFLAKLICHVEKASEFNTSAVNQLIPRKKGSNLRRGRRDVDESEGLRGSFSSVDLHQRKKRSSEHDSSSEEKHSSSEEKHSSSEEKHSSSEEDEEEQWTLYGLFQLSDHLICSDGATPSPDRICNVTCSALVDDEIEDDIGCMLNIISKVMVKLIFQPECNNKTAAQYFKKCKDQ